MPEIIVRYPSRGLFILMLLLSLGAGLVGTIYVVGAFRAVRPGVARKDVVRALNWVRRSPSIEEVFDDAGVVRAHRAVTWCRVQLTLMLAAALVFAYIALRGY